jgi:trehalose/maltose hydrolase-like predicted phosphorylase
MLSFRPALPKAWEKIAFKINFRNSIYTISIGQEEFQCQVEGEEETTLLLNGNKQVFKQEIRLDL